MTYWSERESACTVEPGILLVGTLDTKGEEIEYLRNAISRCGCRCIIMDVGIIGQPTVVADITSDVVIERGGGDRARLIDAAAKGSARGDGVDIVIRGGSQIARELLAENQLNGIISLGGSTGTAIGTSIMRSLPLGIPKVHVSTLPGISKDLSRFFGQSDIMMLNSIVDLVGLNTITRTVLDEAAAAIAGMAKHAGSIASPVACVAITCLGVTTPMVMKVRTGIMERGYEVVVLHRRTPVLGDLVSRGLVKAVLDLTPNEVVDAVVYPKDAMSASRMDSALDAGIPIIMSPGGLDMIIVSKSADEIPDAFKLRRHRSHTPWTTLVRTDEPELRAIGSFIGQSASRAQGPVGIVIPRQGFSTMDREGSDFHSADANRAFIEGLRESVSSKVRIREVDAHIISDEFVGTVLDMFDDMMASQ